MLDKEKCKNLTYIEPFFGSGGAYCNLPVDFKYHECFDIFPYLIRFLNHVQYYFSDDILSRYYDFVHSNWDIKNIRNDYYDYREWWNENHDNDVKCETIGFVVLANACINGMIRFGPHGFNQSFGNRAMTKERLLKSREHIKPNSSFSILDFRKIFPRKESLMYLDPPYLKTGALSKLTGFYEWAEKDDLDLLDLILKQNAVGGYFILSSIYNSNSALIKELSDFNIFPINKKYKVTPWKFPAKDHQEIIITNYLSNF